MPYFVHQNRLEEVLARWQQYRDLLDDCDQYLQTEALPWLQQQSQGATPDNLSHSRQQNITKVCNCSEL
jgi:response regulator of citrate/malate metabolism